MYSATLTVSADNRKQAELAPNDFNHSEAGMSYYWEVTSAPPGATVVLSENDSHAAGTTIATFDTVGEYVFSVTVTNRAGLWTTVPGLSVSVQQATGSIDAFLHGLTARHVAVVGEQLTGAVAAFTDDDPNSVAGDFSAEIACDGTSRSGYVERHDAPI